MKYVMAFTDISEHFAVLKLVQYEYGHSPILNHQVLKRRLPYVMMKSKTFIQYATYQTAITVDFSVKMQLLLCRLHTLLPAQICC